MNREDLLDNLRTAIEHRDVVELELYKTATDPAVTITGRIVGLGPERSSRPRTKTVIEYGPANALRYLVVGLTMIKDLRIRSQWP